MVRRLIPTHEDRLRAAEAERGRLHRLDPAQALKDAADAADFVRERRIVTETGHAGVPVLAHTIAGRELVGSWMASPEVYRIYDLLNELADEDVCFAPLLDGKVTIFDPSLAPAVQRIATDPGRRAALIAQLPPTAANLLRRVEAEGEPLEHVTRRRRVQGQSTDGLPDLEASMDLLVETALRAAVVVSERDARRWFDFAAHRIDILIEAGRIERLTPAPRERWLVPVSPP